jgi:hypothetical protein
MDQEATAAHGDGTEEKRKQMTMYLGKENAASPLAQALEGKRKS